MLGDPPERLPRLVPVAQLLGDDPEIVGDLQHDRLVIAEAELPRRVRRLQHPSRRRRIAQPMARRSQLPVRPQHLGIVLAEARPAELDGTFQDLGRPGKVAPSRQ
ncbi:hypothetical protein [Actinoplanes teichomyceticus]|uniref:Uncharacterized protein n=1 Tax=Actinoplanes teichomyceticus TaxID=1867 RepID=A0A561WKH6_ACTTI|nr:hypothetical protein [Actinoplanes teichomyceticus]TWG24333.1 hypothetical protein FHX34_102887 [Actinoplanes teichomyceticus]